MLIFDAASREIPQLVTVTGGNGRIAGDRAITISHAASGAHYTDGVPAIPHAQQNLHRATDQSDRRCDRGPGAGQRLDRHFARVWSRRAGSAR